MTGYNWPVRLSIWQFVLLAAILAAAFIIYHHWWVDQEREDWIDRINNWILHREAGDEPEADPEASKQNPDGWID